MHGAAQPHGESAPGDGRAQARPELLVVQPDERAGLDRFAGWLTDAGLTLRVVRPYAGEPVPESVTEDGLLVLGGDMGAGDDGEFPWLADIRRLLRHAVATECPTLGICLGGQLLAMALGGGVEVGQHGLETGVVGVQWRSEAQDDPLFAGLPSPMLVGAMHDDVVTTLPESVVWLGHGEVYPHQAFRAGPRAWGVQFHPEVSFDSYCEWVALWDGTDPDAVERLKQGTADLNRLDEDIAVHTQVLAQRFADTVLVGA